MGVGLLGLVAAAGGLLASARSRLEIVETEKEPS